MVPGTRVPLAVRTSKTSVDAFIPSLKVACTGLVRLTDCSPAVGTVPTTVGATLFVTSKTTSTQ